MDMYTNKTSFVFGFHGLDEEIGRKIVSGIEELDQAKTTMIGLVMVSIFGKITLQELKNGQKVKAREQILV